MTRLALRLLRHRPGSATATFVALAVGVMILMAMGSLVESGLRHQPSPQRYAAAAADVVIARTEITFTGKDLDGSPTSTRVRLPEPGPVPAGLADQARTVRGVTDVSVEPSGRPGQAAAILIKASPDVDRGALDKLAAGVGAKTFAGDERGLAEQSGELAARDLLIQVGAAFAGYVVMLVVFVVAGIVGLSVRHRRRDLALLRAIAATPGQVRRMLTAETALISGLATVVGLPAGLLATIWLRGELIGRGFVPAGFPINGGPLAALAAVATTVLVAMLAAVIAARRATAIRPAEALGESAVEPERNSTVRLGFGIVTLAGAGSVGGLAAGAGGQTALAGAVGMLYLFVTAVALLAPWINRGAARLLAPLLRTVWGSSGYLAAANLRANARGMATVLTALVLSVGFGGSVWFLQDNLQRATVEQTRDGVLAQHTLTAPEGLPPGAVAEIRRTPGVSAATGVRETSVLTKFLGEPEVVPARAIDPLGATATMDLDVTEGDLATLDAGSMAVSSSRGWEVGDQVDIWLADGTPANLRVAAVYQRSLGFGDVILDQRTTAFDQILIRTEPGADVAAIAARYPGSTLVPTAELTGALNADLAASAWLNKLLVAVMVGYAALAAANAMVLAALARSRELATLRLSGATRRQLARMVNAEQAGLLGVSLLIGALIAGVTLTAVVHNVTGALLPYIPALGWPVILAGATLLAMTTTILPIRRLLHTRPIEALGARE